MVYLLFSICKYKAFCLYKKFIMEKKGIVYLLEDFRNEERAFKIGFTTKKIDDRIKQLQTGNSAEIILVDFYESKHYLKIEKMLHRKFFSYSKRGEWFTIPDDIVLDFKKYCDECIIVIKALNDNPFYN